jgi:DNA-binding transcriptional regulator LsrR (DeoR family)
VEGVDKKVKAIRKLGCLKINIAVVPLSLPYSNSRLQRDFQINRNVVLARPTSQEVEMKEKKMISRRANSWLQGTARGQSIVGLKQAKQAFSGAI